MAEHESTSEVSNTNNNTQAKEFKAFLFIIIFFFPIITSIAAGGYGFIIWMSQVILGPPGHG
ncbi:TorE protein [Thalassotalea psychrophila]|uniref:TorE protein n=1 Tax=Thalassotalea psychrophila TaxID=3065647 RepID=A0ABY9TSH5_9GAMM|nr:TorE protein [Colwelliaceae bacterium SQ149]